ncbi:MAG: hypothetical protein ACHQUB_03620 [Candidatus Saccharimonadia bacterium]
MSQSRGHKVKALNQKNDADIFWMSLEEAKNAITDKFDYLTEKYEQKRAKKV